MNGAKNAGTEECCDAAAKRKALSLQAGGEE